MTIPTMENRLNKCVGYGHNWDFNCRRLASYTVATFSNCGRRLLLQCPNTNKYYEFIDGAHNCYSWYLTDDSEAQQIIFNNSEDAKQINALYDSMAKFPDDSGHIYGVSRQQCLDNAFERSQPVTSLFDAFEQSPVGEAIAADYSDKEVLSMDLPMPETEWLEVEEIELYSIDDEIDLYGVTTEQLHNS